MSDYMQQLKESGSIGCDLSPGDPVAKWAYETITELRARIEQLEKENGSIRLAAADDLVKLVALTAENAGLREDADRLDWFSSHPGEVYPGRAAPWCAGGDLVYTIHADLRSAIDAARGGES